MKYLDERIIANVTLKSPSLEDRLYRYDVAINDEWDSPIFIGNCFIGANVSTKSIDITDIVRNYYDFSYPYQDAEFQAEWQVRIWLDKDELEHSYSDNIGIYPIYRYPNRKARMETPLSNNGLKWYMPALQGFNSDKKGEFLPHIPFVYSDKVDYNLALNNGNLSDANPYLYTGVKKQLKTADFGIYNTQYKLSELWKSEGYILPATTYDSTFFSTDDIFTKYFDLNYDVSLGRYEIINFYITNSPVFINNIKYFPMTAGSEEQNITPTITGKIGSRRMDFIYNETVSGDNYDNDYIDWYLQYGDNNDFVNVYPTLITPFTSAAYSISFHLKESFLGYGTDLVEIPEGATVVDNTITFSDLTNSVYNIHLQDSDGNNLENAQLGGNLSMPITGYANAAKIVISDIVNDSILKTINIIDSEQFNGQNTLELSWTSSTSTGVTLKINKYCWSGRINYQIDVTGEHTGTTPEKIQVVDEKEKRYYNIQKYIPQKGEIDFSNSEEYDNFGDNWISMNFNEETISENKYTGIEKCTFFIKNKTTGEVLISENYDFYSPDVRSVQVSQPFNETQIIVYVYNSHYDDYKSKIVIDFSKNTDKSIWTLQFKTEGSDFYIESIEIADALPKDNTFDVATIDYCPSRYYLQWRDRYGSMQMQPFNKAETYSEDFTRTEIKNYQDTRRLSGIGIQPKWKLNSAWIPFDLVPYYESLQVSPWVKLYDTKEDQLYDVILKDTAFTEKTFRNNDRQLWHMEIECEQTDKQNILY